MAASAGLETYMILIGLLAQTSFLPQIYRMWKRKSSDDFSLWTSAILMVCNGSWLYYALVISDTPLILQQALTVINLVVFVGLILRYRTPEHGSVG